MDTFVDSAWYYYRYLSPNDDTRAFDPEAVQRWMPVDHYTGGIEHAILHLLYSRFITKVLNDMGMVPFREPFPTLLNQGLVIMEGSKMSKSRGNVVELLPLIDRWGADTIRVAELFVGPVDEDSDWSYASPEAVHSWLTRIWRIAQPQSSAGEDPIQLRKSTHRTIKRVTELYERHRYNVAIARLMELTKEIRSALERGEPAHEAVAALVVMMAPMAPFITEELWREVLGNERSVHAQRWPEADPELSREETVTLVVQVDGKVRDRFDVAIDISEEECVRLARESERVTRALAGREVARVIARPPRLVNLVTR
jgi:leucyl-tRNA synthetase